MMFSIYLNNLESWEIGISYNQGVDTLGNDIRILTIGFLFFTISVNFY